MVGFYERLGQQLSLFVRYQAWLGATPDKRDNEKFDPLPRIKTLTPGEIQFPPNPAEYLTRWLFDIGPAVSGGMGMAALGWRDLADWQSITGVELLPWEARLIRELSHAFVAQNHASRKRDCPSPYSGDADEPRRADVSSKIKSLFGGLKQAGS